MALSLKQNGRPPFPRPQPSICACGKHGFVVLTKWGVAIVDPDDVQALRSRNWHLAASTSGSQSCYAMGGKQFMHRFLLNALQIQRVDHVNRDKLDNRRSNLRFCTDTENQRNRKKPKHATTSKFKGVYLHGPMKWRARIKFGGKSTSLGVFTTETDAALAYDAAAISGFGEFALTNAKLGLFKDLEVQSWR